MKTVGILIIAMIFLLQYFQSIDTSRKERMIERAFAICGGAEKTQWIQLGGLWGGFGWGCMPK